MHACTRRRSLVYAVHSRSLRWAECSDACVANRDQPDQTRASRHACMHAFFSSVNTGTCDDALEVVRGRRGRTFVQRRTHASPGVPHA
jgi:hypothetical protein